MDNIKFEYLLSQSHPKMVVTARGQSSEIGRQNERTPIAWDYLALFCLRPLAQKKERQARAEAQRSQRKDKKPILIQMKVSIWQ